MNNNTQNGENEMEVDEFLVPFQEMSTITNQAILPSNNFEVTFSDLRERVYGLTDWASLNLGKSTFSSEQNVVLQSITSLPKFVYLSRSDSVGKVITVDAGPGSGKTFLLVSIVYKLLQLGENPEDIVFLSFTNRAVQEAAGRFFKTSNLLRNSVFSLLKKAITFSTYHSFFFNVLVKHGVVGKKDILNESQLHSEIKFVMKKSEMNEFRETYSKREVIQNLGTWITQYYLWKADENRNPKPEKNIFSFLELLFKRLEVYGKNTTIFETVFAKVLISFHKGDNDELRKYLGRKIFLLDEKQDMSLLLCTIFTHVNLRKCPLIVCVGDMDQQIFSAQNMSENIDIFFEKVTSLLRFELKLNHRSSKTIQNIVCSLVKKEIPHPSDEIGEKDKLRVMKALDVQSMFRCVVKSISECLKDGMSSICVLARTEKEVIQFSQYLVERGLKPVLLVGEDVGTFFIALDEVPKFTQSKEKNSLDFPEKRIWTSKKVWVSTVHKAKGLEYDSVHIINWVEFVFPKYKRGSRFDRKSESKVNYVAFSRARKRIDLFWPLYLELSSAPSPKRDVSSFLTDISKSWFNELSGVEYLSNKKQININLTQLYDLGNLEFKKYSKKSHDDSDEDDNSMNINTE